MAKGRPEDLQTLGNLALDTMNFGSGLLMLPCCIGIILFCYLLYKSHVIPRVLSVWGLISVAMVLVAAADHTFPIAHNATATLSMSQ